MKHTLLLVLAVVSTLAVAAWASPGAVADGDNGNRAEIRITAPLEAVDCVNNTARVLGLTVNIGAARISGGECDDDDDQGDDDQGDDVQGALNDDDDDDDDEGDCTATCADLVVGESAEVRFTSDAVPLTATEVRQSGGDDEDDDLTSGDSEDVEVEAPIQALDPTARTIQVLGLSVFVGGAEFEGDDDCEDDNGDDDGTGDDIAALDDDCDVPVDFNDLLVGQFVEVELASSLPPFSATEVELEHSGNDVDVEVEGPDGEDLDEDGTAGLSDLTVHIKTKVRIAKRTASAGTHVRTVTRTLHVRGVVAGSHFTLSGLPSGPAKIEISRTTTTGLSTGRTRVVILDDATVPALVRLKKPRGR